MEVKAPSPYAFPEPDEQRGVEFTGVIDLLTQDAESKRVELVMFETRPWDEGEEQLFQLQEKINAYLSFALDGEMLETYPQLEGAPLRLVLRCFEMPPPPAVEFLQHVREQIALQDIDLEVRYSKDPGAGGCGSGGCGCHCG